MLNRFVLAGSLALVLFPTGTFAQTPALGLFEDQSDVGAVLHPGGAEFDAATKTYTVHGSGENMWAGNDAFHFVWKKVSASDVTLAAGIALAGTQGDPHRKAVLVIRQSLDPDAPYADAAIHGNGLAALQYRDAKGAPTREIISSLAAPRRLRVEKHGDRFYLWVSGETGEMQFAGGSAAVAFTPPFYVGIGVCAHNKDQVQTAAFASVDLTTGAPSKTEAPELYSTIQSVAIASADANAIYVSHDHLESPSWSKDGGSILFSDGGKTQQVPATGGTAQSSETELDEFYGQDRSADGRFIYLSSNRSGTVQLWRTAADGSNPEQLTHDADNNANPHLSPDGQQIVFVSYPSRLMILPDNADITLKVMNLADRKTKVLAKMVGGRNTLGAHPWSPDGKQVTYVTYQSFLR